MDLASRNGVTENYHSPVSVGKAYSYARFIENEGHRFIHHGFHE